MNEHILVVDDEELVRTGLAENLSREGFRVSTAASGREALEILSSSAVDLVLTDLVMDEPDGMALLRRITAQSPEIPVVILTGHGSVASAVEACRNGAADYLLKPIKPEEMVRRIRSVLESRDLKHRLQRERERVREQRQLLDVRAERQACFSALERMAAGIAMDLQKVIHRVADVEFQSGAKPALSFCCQTLEDWIQRLERFSGARAGPEGEVSLVEGLRAWWKSDGFERLLDEHPQVHFEFRVTGRSDGRCAPRVVMALAGAVEAAIQMTTGERRVTVSVGEEEGGRIDADRRFLVVWLRFTAALTPDQIQRLMEPYYVTIDLGLTGISPFAFAEACSAVRQAGGCADIRSVPGSRALEIAYLLPASQSGKGEETPAFRARGRERILVVDDSEAHRRHAEDVLSQLGYNVVGVDNSDAAAAWVEKQAQEGNPMPDLVLIDLVLGEATDGLDLFRRLRRIHPGLKAVLVGGFVETERVSQALQEGFLCYLRKPFTLETLGRVVREALDGL